MKQLAFIFLFLSGAVIGNGQTIHQLDKDTSKYKNSPIYILRYDQKTDTTYTASLIDPNDIESIDVIRVKNPDHYTRNGVINVKLKDNIKMVNLKEILDNYYIAFKDRGLPVFIDSAIAYHPETMRLEFKNIRYVKIQKEEGTAMKYISIRSVMPIRRHTADEIMIKGIAVK